MVAARTARLCNISRATSRANPGEARALATPLTDIRMTLAANELEEIFAFDRRGGGAVGYQSERAPARLQSYMGITPAQWRKYRSRPATTSLQDWRSGARESDKGQGSEPTDEPRPTSRR